MEIRHGIDELSPTIWGPGAYQSNYIDDVQLEIGNEEKRYMYCEQFLYQLKKDFFNSFIQDEDIALQTKYRQRWYVIFVFLWVIFVVGYFCITPGIRSHSNELYSYKRFNSWQT